MKAQAAVEYLIIVGVSIIILLPLVVYSNEMVINHNEETKISLAKNAVKKIGENADWVYSQGQPAKLGIQVYFPEGIDQSSISNNTVLLKMRTRGGISDVYQITTGTLNGSIPSNSGYYTVSIIAYPNYVNISW